MAARAVSSGTPALRVDPQETHMLMGSPPSPLRPLERGEEHPLSRSQQLQPGAVQQNRPAEPDRRESRSRAILEIARNALDIKNTNPYDTITPQECCDHKKRIFKGFAVGATLGTGVGVGLTVSSVGFGAPTIPVCALGGGIVGGLVQYYRVRQDIKRGFESWVARQSEENLQRFNQLFDENYNHFREGNSRDGRLMIVPIRNSNGLVMDFSTWQRAVDARRIENPSEWKIDYKRMGITHQTIKNLVENGVIQREGERMDPILLEGLRVLEADLQSKIDLCFKMEEERLEKSEKEKQITRKDRYTKLLAIAKDIEPDLTQQQNK